jgi:chromosome partitioning protein
VRENFEGGTGFGSISAGGGVSRETYDPLTVIGGGGVFEAGQGTLGFSLVGSPPTMPDLPLGPPPEWPLIPALVDSPGPMAVVDVPAPRAVAEVPAPRAMADGHGVSEPTSAVPVYEASGGPNNIVSAAGHRSAKGTEMDGVRQAREPEDPPLAQEAKRAVQILNPSGEIQMPRPPRTRIFCVSNQKGGVGKTTSVVNIAVALALHGNRVLVIDLDPQGNASTGLDVPHHAAIPDVYDCLVAETPLREVVQQVSGIPNLWCVPATIDLAGAEIELVSMVARESRLARALEGAQANYDYVFIDCPPSLGLLTVNALVASQEVMIPIQCEYYALEGVQQLTNNIQLVKNHLNPALDVTTVLLTMYDRRTRLADAVEQDVRAHFGDRVLTAVIPRNVRVSEAPSYGQSVMTYDPGSRGATSYFEAALEIATRGAQVGAA